MISTNGELMNVFFKSFFHELSALDTPIKGVVAKKEITNLAKKHNLDKVSIVQCVMSLQELLGPFDDLDKNIKKQFLTLSAHYFKEKEFQSNRTVRFIARGALYRLCVKTIKTGWNVRKENMFFSRVLIFIGRKGIKLIEWLAEKSLTFAFQAGFYEAPILNMLYRYCQLEPKNIIDEYIKNIPANPSSSPVFKIKGSQSRACALIGIDFLPQKENLYFIESNFTPGHYIERHMLSSDGDPVCRNLINYAYEQGLKKIIYYPTGKQRYFKEEVEIAWDEMARAKGIGIEIVDDAFLGSPLHRMISSDLDYSDEYTLYVISRYFYNPLANYVGQKGMIEQIIASYNEKVNHEDRIQIPMIIDSEAVLNESVRMVDRFPNIIVKNKYIDQAKGIHLFKTDSVPEIARNDDYIVSQYVIPDTIKKNNVGEISEYAYLFRTYLLITPDGPVYAGARKDISGTPIPVSLAEGEISDIAPYIVNITTAGDYCVAHTEEENQRCKTETLKVGKMLHGFLKEKYDLKN